MKRMPALLLCLLLPLVAAPTLAQSRDAEAPVEVEADRLDLDDRAGTAVYTGEVDIRQGSMRLTGDRVEIQRNAQGQLSRAIATGERAYLRSEEHTSELQSRPHLVCRLLLEK